MNPVTVVLSRIEFRPDTATTPRSLPIRVNSSVMPSTAWTPGTGVNGVAYVARQWRDEPDRVDIAITVEVIAKAAAEIWIAARPTKNSSPVLGQLSRVSLHVAAGASVLTLPVTLTGAQLRGAAIARHLVQWEWMTCDATGANAAVFASTDHLVYITLDEPVFPWAISPTPGADYPWIDALDWACRWAAGERTAEGALERVTRSVDALGGMAVNVNGRPTRFTYASRSYFVTLQDLRFFRLRRFLSLLTGATDITAARANCADLAAAIAVFSNLLGCRTGLKQLEPGSGSAFPLNQVRLFGLDEAGSLPHIENGFGYHRIAADETATCDAAYDACVQLDFEGAPGVSPFCWAPATGTILHGHASAGYLDRLVHASAPSPPEVRSVAVPQITTGTVPAPDRWIEQRFAFYGVFLRANLPAALPGRSLEDGENGLVLVGECDWERDRHGALRGRRFLAYGGSPGTLVELQEIACKGFEQAIEVSAEILASSMSPFAPPAPPVSPFHLRNRSGTEAVFVYADRVIAIGSIGAEPFDAASWAIGVLGPGVPALRP